MEDLRFKFRVWDNVTNKMIHLPRHFNAIMVNGTVCIVESYQNMSGFYKKKVSKEFDDAVLMQCTGLKDKNGELVYFDDFIKLDDGIICIVKQIDDINDIEYGKVIAIPVFCFNKKYQTRYIPTIIAEGEKVGNFYENPELLESEVE